MFYLNFIPVSQAVLPPFFTILLGGGLISLAWSMVKTVQQGVNYLKKLHQVPCDRCAFHTNSYLLKCTVHPSKAFTEESIGCLDYEPTCRRISPCSQPCQRKDKP
ncbi:MAG: hypothetical protein KME11_06140 [Timaviella obliquedivisa GSE-PSE-MK23-08B]|jgi:hypothetical protein|nr:hypothetical protein [Timaviella obliquedivisa GSE-PSE-MK23-08B]